LNGAAGGDDPDLVRRLNYLKVKMTLGLRQKASPDRPAPAGREDGKRLRPFSDCRERSRELGIEALWSIRPIRSPPSLANEDLSRRFRCDDDFHSRLSNAREQFIG
jgi:hypothetical protein